MKRWLVRICVFLLLGAIINVAVAWGGMSLNTLRVSDASLDHRVTISDKHAVQDRTRSLQALGWRPTPADSTYIYRLIGAPLHDNFGRSILWIEESDLNPDFRGIFSGFMESRQAAIEYIAGWPMQSLRGDAWNKTAFDWRRPAPQWVAGSVILLGGTGNGFDTFDLALPLLPIWPGFAINTVFYAFIVWLLFAVPFVLRRRRRIRRGLCPKCAYPVGTSDVCTECGARVRQP